jgi:hypothetical protein
MKEIIFHLMRFPDKLKILGILHDFRIFFIGKESFLSDPEKG